MKRPFPILGFLLALSILAFFFLFRSEPVKFKEVKLEGKFSISIPEYLVSADNADPNALLQYQNEKEQLFVVVYERRDTFPTSIEASFKKFTDRLIPKIGDAVMVKYYPKRINAHHAMIGNIRGKVNGTGVYYRVALIEAGRTCYEIIIGIADDNRSNFEEDINSILASFRPAQ